MGSMAFDLYNFKWEASPGLEHHCGICSKGLNNPRSVSTCIGIHCEPCRRYHQQLHFIQKAHECKSCIRADEMHHRRHRNIAQLVKELETHDRQVATQATRTKTRSAKDTQSATPETETPGNDENIGNEDVPKTGEGNAENVDPVTSARLEDPHDDDIAYHGETVPFITAPNPRAHMQAPSTPKPGSSISSFGNESSPAPSSKKKDLKKARRTARLTNNNAQSIVSNGFLDFIAEALHGNKITDISSAMFEEEGEEISANQFKNEELMRENLGFQPFTRNSVQVRNLKDRWKKLGHRGKAQELEGPCPTAPGFPKPNFVNIDETTQFDVNFFARLGVNYENKSDTSKIRGEIVTKLVNSIIEDMTIMGREEYETQVREAGFWRFVNRAAAQNLQEAHQDFSWATGEFRKRRNPGMLSEGNAEPALVDNAADEPGQEIGDHENDLSDDESVPGTPSLVGSAFETQAEEEKEAPQVRTPFVLKFTNFDVGQKEVLWTATPSKVVSSPQILASLEPSLEVPPPAEVLATPKASFPLEVSSEPGGLISPKAPSSPMPLFSHSPLPSYTVWSSLKKRKMKPSKQIANHDKSGPMNLYRLVKIEKKHVAVQSDQGSPRKVYDQFSAGQASTTAPTSEFEQLEVDDGTSHNDDDWEVVRPSLPNVRAKNPYDLLSTVDEGSDNVDSSSEED
ncbi:hypothetical protein V492_06595 [Pseudogymnoascus sp. VKM F-4246]|nr:hypothetical protein V492_06595 [Pseudogymnoascus sp. VKM F-4246]